jgi:hypothetical protein
MIKPPERVEIPEEEEPRERFARFLAICIVVSTLLLALVEFAHGNDTKSMDSAAIEAQNLGAERQGEVARAEALAQSDLAMFGLTEQERTQAGNASQTAANQILAGADDAQSIAAIRRFDALAELSQTFTTITESGPNGPDSDPAFPNRTLSLATKESELLFAKQDAANEEREAWETRLSQYSVILTMLAVAVYLFGLSLTLQAAVRRIITGLALALVLVSAGWSGGLQIVRPSRAPDAAAEAYAQGRVDAAVARSPEDLKKAEDDFSEAINARPTFAQAYVQRAGVRFVEGSPEVGSSFISITTQDALRSSTADLQKAYDLGLRNYLLLYNLSSQDVLISLYDNRPELLSQAIALAEKGIEVDGNNPAQYGNLVVARLLAGDSSGADSALDKFIDHIVYVGEKHTPRNDQQFAENQLAGVLTPLQLIVDRQAGGNGSGGGVSAEKLQSIKEKLVNAVVAPKQSRTLKASDATVDVFASKVQWSATIPDLQSDDTVSVEWYHNDPGKLGWSAIASVSGAVTPTPNGPPDQYFENHPFLVDTGQCTSPGRYRAEIYVNGHLAATAETDASKLTLNATFSRDIGVALCRPDGWVHDDDQFIRGFEDTFLSGDKKHGAVIYRVQNPNPAIGTDAASRATSYRDQLLDITSVMPSNLTVDAAQTKPLSQFFLGLKSTTVAIETNSSGQEAEVGCGVADDGSIIIGTVFGPSSDFDDGNAGDELFHGLVLEAT